MWWDASAIVCALLALGLRVSWDDDRGPRVSASLGYLSLIFTAWSTYRLRVRRQSGRG